MGILILIVIGLCVYQMKLYTFHDDYISKSSTDSIKGIFTIIILYSHLRGYLPPSKNLPFTDYIFYIVLNLLGQLMVVMFLFYSGYGILESYKIKRYYKEHFFKKRFLKTLLNFDIAVVLFMILSIILSHEYSLKEYLLSLTGYETIGNSNWFVFDILVLYLLSCICLHLFKPANLRYLVLSMYILTVILVVVLYVTKSGSYWYDTILAFPTGMLFSLYKHRLEDIFRKNYSFYSLLFVSILIFALLMKYGGGIGNMLNSMLFSIIIVMITTRVKFDNIILRWLGMQCFAVYILQRIPMIVFSELGLNNDWISFSIAVIPTTFLLASLFTKFTNTINQRIFS